MPVALREVAVGMRDGVADLVDLERVEQAPESLHGVLPALREVHRGELEDLVEVGRADDGGSVGRIERAAPLALAVHDRPRGGLLVDELGGELSGDPTERALELVEDHRGLHAEGAGTIADELGDEGLTHPDLREGGPRRRDDGRPADRTPRVV